MFWLDPKWLNQRIREGNKTATCPCDSFQSLFSFNDSLDYMTRQSNYFCSGLRKVNRHFFYYKWQSFILRCSCFRILLSRGTSRPNQIEQLRRNKVYIPG